MDIVLQDAFRAIADAIKNGKMSVVAEWMAKEVIPLYLRADIARHYFQVWEENGFHITENSFYSPIPDTRKLSEELWEKASELIGIEMNESFQLHLLREIFPQFWSEYSNFRRTPTGDPHEFYFNNGSFDAIDALVLYCFIRHFHPRTILEIGSGMSTRVSAMAAAMNRDTSLISIEPYPEDAIRTLPGLSRLIEKPVQDVELQLFESLRAGDVLFIDSTHVVRMGSDVCFLYLEILPRLQPGVIVHAHDIFLPSEYPRDWVMNQHYFWNEQYLLHAFLLFNSAYEVLFGNKFMSLRHNADFQKTFPEAPKWRGGSFWMRRVERG